MHEDISPACGSDMPGDPAPWRSVLDVLKDAVQRGHRRRLEQQLQRGSPLARELLKLPGLGVPFFQELWNGACVSLRQLLHDDCALDHIVGSSDGATDTISC